MDQPFGLHRKMPKPSDKFQLGLVQASKQQPTTNNQQPTTNNQQPATSNGAANEQRDFNCYPALPRKTHWPCGQA
jgi:hypothetical protein